MSDAEKRQKRSGLPSGGLRLGSGGADDYDSSLRQEPEGEHSEAEAAPTDQDNGERLQLPRGALVAFRKSGGLRFSSRGVVVYRTGWITPLEGTARPRHLAEDALGVLERLLLRSGLTRTSHHKTRSSPDAYSYEIAALVGGRERVVECHDGAIPAELERLIRVLQRLLPRE